MKIEKGLLSDLEEVFTIYLEAKKVLEENEIYQWTDKYPTLTIIENDLRKGVLFTLKYDNKIIGQSISVKNRKKNINQFNGNSMIQKY